MAKTTKPICPICKGATQIIDPTGIARGCSRKCLKVEQAKAVKALKANSDKKKGKKDDDSKTSTK